MLRTTKDLGLSVVAVVVGRVVRLDTRRPPCWSCSSVDCVAASLEVELKARMTCYFVAVVSVVVAATVVVVASVGVAVVASVGVVAAATAGAEVASGSSVG